MALRQLVKRCALQRSGSRLLKTDTEPVFPGGDCSTLKRTHKNENRAVDAGAIHLTGSR